MKRIIPYRGDLTSARLNYKKQKKQALRKFKRHLLRHWDISKKIVLWDKWSGYVNDDVRKVLGIEENFLESTKNLTWFGVKLNPVPDIDKVINLQEDQKDYLRDKCLNIFSKYGKTVKVKYNGPTSYDYIIYKDKIETSFDIEEDEELAVLLYRRLIMYMVDNDSTDTTDKWSDVNPNEVDFFNGGSGSKLKYFKYTFSDEDILKVVNDRLFTKRTYETVTEGTGGDDGYYDIQVKTIDKELLNELLDNGSVDNLIVDDKYWTWNKSSKTYEINFTAVENLEPDEFLIFIQTHLDTFQKVKKKWYQSGLFGFVVVVVAMVVAAYTGQWQLVGLVVGVTGALIGNQFMMIGGTFISFAGSLQSLSATVSANNATMEASKSLSAELVKKGYSDFTIELLKEKGKDALLNNLMSIGKFAYNSYSTFNSLNPSEQIMPEPEKPKDVERVVFSAEDDYWDGINAQFPEVVIPNTIKVM